MNNAKQHARLFDLQCKAAFGLDLTAVEEQELESLAASEDTTEPGQATQAQKDYINQQLERLNADPGEYDIDDVDELTFDEASEAIDGLKDAVNDAEAWD